MPTEIALTDKEFIRIRDLLYRNAGISLSDNKKTLVTGRLARRLDRLGLRSYSDYLDLMQSDPAGEELARAVDLLTTNETYFWREPAHFEHLAHTVRTHEQRGRSWRIWSAACSSGEETYTIAMML
jgi:chemotaxis protein methyltransferase CheR